jgi:hypothetical protein
MIEKFAQTCAASDGEFLDLNHTRNSMILVSFLIPKFAQAPGTERRRTPESGH